MKRWLVTTLLMAMALSCAPAADEEPVLPEQSEGLEIDPPLLIKTRDREGLPEVPATAQTVDIAKLEKDLARGKRNAAGADRQYKAGIISKQEAEARVVNVVRLEALLAQAKLEATKSKADEEKTEAELADAEATAKRAAEERRKAEIEFAMRNVQRQQKLLALGSGRKADVSRAEKKISGTTAARRLSTMLCLAFFCAVLVGARADEPLKTIEDRLGEYGQAVQQRLAPKFAAANLSYPPKHLAFVGIKKDRLLEVYAANTENEFHFICAYPILGASGSLGPKLREGDLQVPEGIYRVRELNPNSLYHLSIWIDYPNEFDLARAAEENRTEPGSEIMIHGSEHSRGCLAMGDEVSEDLFVLTALAGIENTTIILTPIDFRKESLDELPSGAPPWTRKIYQRIKTELARYPFTEKP